METDELCINVHAIENRKAQFAFLGGEMRENRIQMGKLFECKFIRSDMEQK